MLPDRIIDCHVHLFPDRLFEAIWSYFRRAYGRPVLHELHYRDCIDYLRERQVEHIVYSNYAHKKGVAGPLNRWNMRILDEFPDLYCFAAYHPDDDDALEMAAELIQHPRVLGFKLQLLVQRFYPQDERLFPLYEMVIEQNKRLLFHAGTGPVGNPFVGITHFRKLLERYPGLPVTVAHMGGLEYASFMELLDRYPDLYLDTTWAFLPQSNFMFDQAPETLERHRERIVYGSDFPNLIFPREDEIECLLGLGLSEDFYRRLFRENGLALLGLSDPSPGEIPRTCAGQHNCST